MAGTFNPTGTYSNLTRLELEQLRRGDFATNGKALTIGDSGLLPEGVVGPGNVNAEKFYTNPPMVLGDVYPITPPTDPGRVLGKLFQVTGQSYTTPEDADIGQWFGPKVISEGGPDPTGMQIQAVAPASFVDLLADFVADGVAPGDIVLIGGSSGTNSYAAGVVNSVLGTTALDVINIKGGAGTGLLVNSIVGKYYVLRADAVQLLAVPGSGPLGQEQTFLFCKPGSTLHINPNPSDYNINVDRIRNIISPKYVSWDGSQDRADAVFPAPAPNLAMTRLGYRVVLYPDDGTGTGPDMSKPIAALNPVIDPNIPANDQRMTIDYAAGVVRFSCAPALGGDIKVAGGVNSVTGRLNLYAVFWAFDTTLTANTSQGLYVPRSNQFNRLDPARFYFDDPTLGWVLTAVAGNLPNTTGTRIQVTNNGPASAELRIWDQLGSAVGQDLTLIQKANAGFLTAGDGTSSFGDFQTSTAIEYALNIWQTHAPSVNSMTLYLKHGNYNIVSNLTLPTGKELIIKGEGRGSTTITMSSGSYPLDTAVRSQIVLEDLTLVGGGPPFRFNGSFRAKKCRFQNIYVFMQTGAAPYTGNGTPVLFPPLHVVEDCEWYIDNSLYPLYADLTNAGSPSFVSGFHYTNCTFRGNLNGNPIIYVENGGNAVTSFNDLYFTKCKIEVGCRTSDTPFAMTGPSGVMVVDTGGVDRLTVNNINFIDCNVGINNNISSGNTILLSLMPVNWDATNVTSSRAILGKVRIAGGTWSVPDGRGSNFTPFFLQCLKPILENVTFVGGNTPASGTGVPPGYHGNGNLTDTQKISLRTLAANIATGSTQAQSWATVAASGAAIEAYTGLRTDSGLVVKSVSFNNFNRIGGPSGVLTLYGPNLAAGPVDVSGIDIKAIGTTGIDSFPSASHVAHWVVMVPGGIGTTNRGSNGTYRGISFTGLGALPTLNDYWAGVSFIAVQDEGRLVLEDLFINPSLNAGNPVWNTAYGVRALQNFWGDSPQAPQGGLQLIRPTFYNLAGSILIQGTSGSKYVIRNATIRCADGPNTTIYAGIQMIFSTRISNFEISGCDIYSNGNNNSNYIGILVQGATWDFDRYGQIVNNMVMHDCGSGTIGINSFQIRVLSGTSGSPFINIVGNTCTQVSGGFSQFGTIKLSKLANVALQSPAGPLDNGYCNVETGHSDATPTLYHYVNNNLMVRNSAYLRTP